jgi:hypothetical protein
LDLRNKPSGSSVRAGKACFLLPRESPLSCCKWSHPDFGPQHNDTEKKTQVTFPSDRKKKTSADPPALSSSNPIPAFPPWRPPPVRRRTPTPPPSLQRARRLPLATSYASLACPRTSSQPFQAQTVVDRALARGHHGTAVPCRAGRGGARGACRRVARG